MAWEWYKCQCAEWILQFRVSTTKSNHYESPFLPPQQADISARESMILWFSLVVPCIWVECFYRTATLAVCYLYDRSNLRHHSMLKGIHRLQGKVRAGAGRPPSCWWWRFAPYVATSHWQTAAEILLFDVPMMYTFQLYCTFLTLSKYIARTLTKPLRARIHKRNRQDSSVTIC